MPTRHSEITKTIGTLASDDFWPGVDKSDTSENAGGSSAKIFPDAVKAYVSPPASTDVAGIAEFATAAEYRAKAASKTLTPDLVYDAAAEVALISSSNLTAVDFNTGINFKIDALGENTTLSNPTNATVGQSGFMRVVQDGTGSRTMAFGVNFEFPGGSPPTLSTDAGAEDILFYTAISPTRIIVSAALDIS